MLVQAVLDDRRHIVNARDVFNLIVLVVPEDRVVDGEWLGVDLGSVEGVFHAPQPPATAGLTVTPGPSRYTGGVALCHIGLGEVLMDETK